MSLPYNHALIYCEWGQQALLPTRGHVRLVGNRGWFRDVFHKISFPFPSCHALSMSKSVLGLFVPFIIYPPTTPQSVFPVADQRVDVRGACSLRRSCGGNRRTPLTGESERVLPQSGHSTNVTELAVNRLRSMGTTVRENVHLGDALVCTGSSAVSTVFVVFCCSFSGGVCCSDSFPFALAGSAPSGWGTSTLGPAPSSSAALL